LSQEPPVLSQKIYKSGKYFVFDGTYFHKDGCLAVFMNAVSGKPIYTEYITRENYDSVMPLVRHLHTAGMNPVAFTTDGHPRVIQALKELWPSLVIQRCLFHIQNQGLMWLRSYPKSQAGKELRVLCATIARIRTLQDMNIFKAAYDNWHCRYKAFVLSLPRDAVSQDLRRAMSLINHALPDMFHFIFNKNIVSTTNILEGFFSQLKHQYRNHRGLSERHKISYLKWYCYFKLVKK